MYNALTDVPGIQVGHAQDLKAATGCTVILCPPGTVGGMDIRGSAAGTRQVDSLLSFHLVDEVHAVLLSGGSAFGLEASSGVMKYLEEKGIGFRTATGKVPIVPTAILYDLAVGEDRVRPDKEMGYQACMNRQSGKIEEGSVGVGTGASVGKVMGVRYATKGGLGTSSRVLSNGIIVAALVAVNAFGDVISPKDGRILAGARNPDHPESFIDSAARIKERISMPRQNSSMQNTTLGVVATNVKLSKPQAIKVAQLAQNGFSRTLSPAHTTVDGDLIFVLSAGEVDAELNAVGLLAEEVIVDAVIRAIRKADGLGLLPAFRDLFQE